MIFQCEIVMFNDPYCAQSPAASAVALVETNNDQVAYIQWLVSEGRRLSMPFLVNFFETDPVFTGPTGSVTLTFGFRTAAPELRHRAALSVFDAQLP